MHFQGGRVTEAPDSQPLGTSSGALGIPVFEPCPEIGRDDSDAREDVDDGEEFRSVSRRR